MKVNPIKFSYSIPILAAVTYGVKSILDKQVALQSDSLLTATTVNSFASALCVMTLMILVSKKDMSFVRTSKRQLMKLAIVGSIASGLVVWLIFLGLEESSATFAALNQGVAALSTVILATIILKEQLPRSFYFALPLMIFGTYLVSVGGFKSEAIKTGDILILGAAGLIGVSIIIAKDLLNELPLYHVTLMRFIFGGLTTLLIALVSSESIQFDGFSWMIASGVVTAVFVILLYEGIRRVGASITSSLVMFAPVFTSFLSWGFLGESFNAVQLFGMLLVMAGGITISIKS